MRIPRVRFTVGRMMLATASLAALTAWFGLFRPEMQHHRWYQEVECLIIRLAPRRPPEVSPQQWAFCLNNTWNLHTNYGNRIYWTPQRRDEFARQLRERLRGRVGLDTVDWFWDAYARAAPRSKSYLRYRPTTAERLQEADSAVYDLEYWLRRNAQQDCDRMLADH